MIEITSKYKCSGCGACHNICPQNCIEMIEDSEGFLYPKVNIDKCIGCNLCEQVCPIQNKIYRKTKDIVYVCYAKDYHEHFTSSSGGFFSVLARYILDNDGFVYGASFDNQFNVKHICVNDVEHLNLIKGTKYVQSEIGHIFKEIKKRLNEGKKVLFSGTSCQVAGLKMYLKKEYENLITVDLICHGVPSPKVWRQYLKELSNGRKITMVNFRDKTDGINDVFLDFQIENGKLIQERYSENIYIKGFIQNMFLRPSCFDCWFKGENRSSDFTIGDYWGKDCFEDRRSKQLGISTIIIHTKTGIDIFSKFKDNLNFKVSDIDKATIWNSCYKDSVRQDKKREEFYNLYTEKGVINTISLLNDKYKRKKLSFENVINKFRGMIK